MSFSAFSQSLTPKVQVQNKDTLFCFTIPQSKVIAKHLENGRYCDSVLTKTENEIDLLNQLQTVNDSSMLILKMKTENQKPAGKAEVKTKTAPKLPAIKKKPAKKNHVKKKAAKKNIS